jgi:hypothetical protein
VGWSSALDLAYARDAASCKWGRRRIIAAHRAAPISFVIDRTPQYRKSSYGVFVVQS